MREDHEGFTLFYKQHFYKQRQTKLTKNQAKAKQHLETELLLFENYSLSFHRYHPKMVRGYCILKNVQKQVRLF